MVDMVVTEQILNGSFEEGIAYWKYGTPSSYEIVNDPHTGLKAVKIYRISLATAIWQVLSTPILGSTITKIGFWVKTTYKTPYFVFGIDYSDSTSDAHAYLIENTEYEYCDFLEHINPDKYVVKVWFEVISFSPVVDDVTLLADLPPVPPPPTPLEEYPNPNRQVTVEDDDVSQDAITTLVEKRENAIDMVTLTANNEDGANYLSTLHLNDIVKVKMIRDSNPPTPINWDTDPNVRTVFKGRIQELSPILNKAGQICRVIALGNGFQLKEMRVNKQYGAIVPLFSLGNTYSYEEIINQWTFLLGYSPYIDSYAGNLFTFFGKGLFNIFCVLGGNLGQEIGYFTFMVDPEYDGIEFDSVELHIVAGIYGDLTSANIMPYYSIDNGETWHKFTGDLQFNITTKLSANPNTDPAAWSDLNGYNPLSMTSPPKGQDISINIKTDLGYWNKNFRIKLKIVGVGGTPADEDVVSVKYMWLEYTFKANAGKTVRQIIAGDEHTSGIIDKYINHILGDNSLSSGYDPWINTDYVYGYLEIEDEYKIPYINFPYVDGLTSIQDIIKYASGLKFLQSAAGYHWIMDEDGNLLLAPVSNHDVYGIDDEHLISDKWVLQPYATSIKVKQDMVTQSFRQEIPLANFILIAGRYKYPLNDEICKGLNIGLWQTSGGIGGIGERKIFLDAYDPSNNGYCLHMTGSSGAAPFVNINNVYAYPLPEDLQNGGLLKLMGKSTIPTVSFIWKNGGNTSGYELRFYREDPDDPEHPDTVNYFKYAFSATQQDTWELREIPLPNTKYMKDMKGWEIVTEDGATDWSDFDKVKYFAFRFTGDYNILDIFGERYCKVMGLSFNGTVIYGLYDSSIITDYGCRTVTIKNTYAITDTLDIDDIAKTPLGLECLYELKRYSKLRITGEVAIPLDPEYKAGQQVWLLAEQDTEGNYKINDWFRITKVSHEFNATGALTRLEVTDDKESSIPINTNETLTVIMRTINIDFQTRTMGSVKSYADFDTGLEPILRDINA